MPKLASKYNCSGCMGCHDRCSKEAISIKIGSDGHRYITVDESLCVECGMCEKVCPIVNGTAYGTDPLVSKFMAGWSSNKEIRLKGATAGIFGALAKKILSQGGYVVGTRMEGLECRYCIIDNIEDLPALQGSKYTSSNPSGIYRATEAILKEGKTILFCGLPCHVAACLSYIKPSLRKNLITVDLVCGGVSSPKLLDIYCRNTSDISEVISFRNKDNGWHPKGYKYNFRYLNKAGELIDSPIGQKNIVTDGFACELTDRWSCYNCRFSKMHRECDLTIGDLWGDTQFKSEHKDGVSLIMVHSEKGLEILKQSEITLEEINGLDALSHNRRAIYGKSIKRLFPERIFLGFILNHFSYNVLKRVYASDLRTKNFLWWPFALWRICSFRLARKMVKKGSDLILKSVFI